MDYIQIFPLRKFGAIQYVRRSTYTYMYNTYIHTYIPLGTMLRNAISLDCILLATSSQYDPIKANLKLVIIRTLVSMPPLILLVMLNKLVPCVLISRGKEGSSFLLLHHLISTVLMLTVTFITQVNIAVPPIHPVVL